MGHFGLSELEKGHWIKRWRACVRIGICVRNPWFKLILSLYSYILMAEGRSGVISFYITKTISSTRSKSPASNNAKGGSWYSRIIKTSNSFSFNPQKLADVGRCCKFNETVYEWQLSNAIDCNLYEKLTYKAVVCDIYSYYVNGWADYSERALDFSWTIDVKLKTS